MFDLGFSKFMLIGVVALVVIGPERLPRVARTVGALLGKAQRYVNEVKREVNQAIELDELRKAKESMESAARDLQETVRTNASAFEQQVGEVTREFDALGQQADKALKGDAQTSGSAWEDAPAGTASDAGSESASHTGSDAAGVYDPYESAYEGAYEGAYEDAFESAHQDAHDSAPEDAADPGRRAFLSSAVTPVVYTPPRKNWRSRRSAVPAWYKARQQVRTRLRSATARAARAPQTRRQG